MHADRHVDEEDPLPAEVLGQHAAGEHADRGARAADRAPDPERLVALGALLERRHDDRERGRRDDRRAEALNGARADQHAFGAREAAGERGGGEDDHAGEEDAAPAEEVGRAAAEQEEAAERDRVGGDDPLEVRRARSAATLPIDGSATLTIETSRMVMKNAAQTTASAFQRRGSSSAISLPPCVCRLLKAREPRSIRRRSQPQCRKWRRPVKTIAAPAAFTAAMHLVVALRAARLDDRASRRRRARAAGRPRTGRTRRSRATAPARSWPSSRAFSIAIRTASTRLIWPAPMPIVCRSFASTIAFEVTCLQTRQAKSRSPHCSSLGVPATTSIGSRSSTSASRSCTSRPPSTRL